MIKKIKPSKRGLTFSLGERDISIGTHYRYVIDNKKKQIFIIPDSKGPLKVSKKKSGNKLNSLIDLRSKEVKEIISDASYLEVEVRKTDIVVYTYKKTSTTYRVLKGKKCSLSDVLGVKSSEIVLPMTMASGSDCYQFTIEDYLSSFIMETNQNDAEIVSKITNEITKVYDVVSLFSGAGLFDKAWLDGGRFKFVYANDFCQDVIETYKYNIGNHITCKDIRNVQPEELPFADVFSASPCCQAYSNSNRRNIDTEESKAKRLLVEEVVRLAKEKKPKVIVIENVPQMLTKENGIYISKAIEGLSDYEASVQVVTDYKVGGYSQRQRCIVILSLIGKIELPQLELLPYKTVKNALSKVDPTWFNYNDISIGKEETVRKMSYVKPGGNWRDIPKEIFEYKEKTHSNVMRRLDWDEIAPTIANIRKDNILHPEQNRILSISEAAAIMGLNKDFRFISSKLSAMQQMVANGVTQAIGKLVKNTVLKALDKNEEQLCAVI